MQLYDQLQNEIKNAMINKNTVKRDCLRSIISDIKNQTVNAGKELSEDIVLKCIQKSVKQHKDSIDSFKSGGREDLAIKEIEELSYLECYLPKMLSETETMHVISEIISNNNIEPIKKNMGMIMKLLPSNVDKKLSSKIISTLLK
jgi:uncharacterized protein YqeY